MEQGFLYLVRSGIGHRGGPPPKNIDWNAIEALAERQGLLAIILDGVESLPNEQRPPQEILLQWIGRTLQEYEQRYGLYSKAIADLAGFYNKHGYKMMVLKGYACSLDWPRPEHRPCGDIDIWQFGRQKEADAALTAWFKSSNDSKVKSFKIDNSHHHHTVFGWNGFTVENHYDFINVHHHASHRGLEAIFKDLGNDDSHHVEVRDEKVYIPSPNLHALFLMRHMLNHFPSIGINLRNLLDWAFFVEKHTKEVDWEWLQGILEEHGMLPFFQIMNAICVENLGFSQAIFPEICFNPLVKEKVLNEIFSYTYQADGSSNFFKRQIYRYRRWKANEWKHELCYKESMWSAFWSGVWGHLLKPASI